MNKPLCYLGIFIILFFILMPPILRIVLPSKESLSTITVEKRLLLACQSTNYFTTTNYVDEKVTMVMIKKNIPLKEKSESEIETINDETENNSSIDEGQNEINNELIDGDTTETSENSEFEKSLNTTSDDFNQIFSDLASNAITVHTVMEDGEVIKIDFANLESSELIGGDYISKTLNQQKEFYESMGLSCSIRE